MKNLKLMSIFVLVLSATYSNVGYAQGSTWGEVWRYDESSIDNPEYPCNATTRPQLELALGPSFVIAGHYNPLNPVGFKHYVRLYTHEATPISGDFNEPSIAFEEQSVPPYNYLSVKKYQTSKNSDEYYAFGFLSSNDPNMPGGNFVTVVRKYTQRGLVWNLPIVNNQVDTTAVISGAAFRVNPEGTRMTVAYKNVENQIHQINIKHFNLNTSPPTLISNTKVPITATTMQFMDISADANMVYIPNNNSNPIIFDVSLGQGTSLNVSNYGNSAHGFSANGDIFARIVNASGGKAVAIFKRDNNSGLSYSQIHSYLVSYYHGSGFTPPQVRGFAVSGDGSKVTFTIQNSKFVNGSFISDAMRIIAFSIKPRDIGTTLLNHELTWNHQQGSFALDVVTLALKMSYDGNTIVHGMSQDYSGSLPEVSIYELDQSSTAPVFTYETYEGFGSRKGNLWHTESIDISPDGNKVAMAVFGCYNQTGVCVDDSGGKVVLLARDPVIKESPRIQGIQAAGSRVDLGRR